MGAFALGLPLQRNVGLYTFPEDFPFLEMKTVIATVTYHERDLPVAQFYLDQPFFNVSCYRPRRFRPMPLVACSGVQWWRECERGS